MGHRDVSADTYGYLESLIPWLDSNGLGSGAIHNVRTLAGGTQHRLIAFERSGRNYVLKTPVPHAPAQAGVRIQREARVLRALKGTDVPHPSCVASSDGGGDLGAPFFVMEWVEGFNPVTGLPIGFKEHPELCRRLGLSLIDGLAALSRVDYKAAGLEGFGNVEDWPQHQVARWSKQLATCAQYPQWPGPANLGPVEKIGAWLENHLPPNVTPSVVHGDYHIGNVLFSADNGRTAAIVDWELATLGDPLFDLGRLLAVWPDPDGDTPFIHKVTPWEGFPHRDELIAAYSAATERSLGALLWFEVMACYRNAIMLEISHAFSTAGLVDTAAGARCHASAKDHLARAAAWLEARG